MDATQRSVVRDWFAEQGYCTPSGVPAHIQPDPTTRPVVTPPPTKGYVRPPIDELNQLWSNSCTIEAALQQPAAFSKQLSKWIIRRRFSPKVLDTTNCVRILPLPNEHKYPEWFPINGVASIVLQPLVLSLMVHSPASIVGVLPTRKVTSLQGRRLVGLLDTKPVGC